MSISQAYSCDGCGKPIMGAGRHWMLLVQTQQISRDPACPPRHNAHLSMEQKHFHGPECLAPWAVKLAQDDVIAQNAHDEALSAKAAEKLARENAAAEKSE